MTFHAAVTRLPAALKQDGRGLQQEGVDAHVTIRQDGSLASEDEDRTHLVSGGEMYIRITRRVIMTITFWRNSARVSTPKIRVCAKLVFGFKVL